MSSNEVKKPRNQQLYLILRHPKKDTETANSYRNKWHNDRVVLQIETTRKVILALENWGSENVVHIYRTGWSDEKPRIVSHCFVDRIDRETNTVFFTNQTVVDLDPPFRANMGMNLKIIDQAA